jgi:hypothetical protein
VVVQNYLKTTGINQENLFHTRKEGQEKAKLVPLTMGFPMKKITLLLFLTVGVFSFKSNSQKFSEAQIKLFQLLEAIDNEDIEIPEGTKQMDELFKSKAVDPNLILPPGLGIISFFLDSFLNSRDFFEATLPYIKVLAKNGLNLKTKNKHNMTASQMVVNFTRGILKTRFRKSGETLNKTPQVLELYKVLIDSGLNVNEKSREGYTLLHYAAIMGKTELGKLLIEKKADKSIKDKSGKTALELASDRNYTPFVEVLEI